ncbi:MAG TPA: hypothetical protein VLH77_04320 [Gammaproteobacteria bacterium]|nr:hypothetical protein [Gammaproteobacteria bacterium]
MAKTSLYNLLFFLNRFPGQIQSIFSKKCHFVYSLGKCFFRASAHLNSFALIFSRALRILKTQLFCQKNLSSCASATWIQIPLTDPGAGRVALFTIPEEAHNGYARYNNFSR